MPLNRRVAVALRLGGLLALGGFALGGKPTAAAEYDPDGLVVQLTPIQDTYEHLTPALVEIAYINIRDVDLEVTSTQFGKGKVSLVVLDMAGGEVPVVTLYLDGGIRRPPQVIRARDTVHFTMDVSGSVYVGVPGTRLYALPVGDYDVRIDWDLRMGRERPGKIVSSNVVRLSIVPPKPEHRAAYDKYLAALRQEGAGDKAVGHEALLDLVLDSPDAPWAERALSYLVSTSWYPQGERVKGMDNATLARMYMSLFPDGRGLNTAMADFIRQVPEDEKEAYYDTLLIRHPGTKVAREIERHRNR